MRRYHLLVIATRLGVGLLVFDFLTLPKISEATSSPNNSQLREETSVAVNPPNRSKEAWQIMPAEDATSTSHGVELNPTTYICACAKCGSTSLYS